MNEIGNIIKKIRIKQGLSQEQIAKSLGISANYISLIENGAKRPGMPLLKKISKKYDFPIVILAKDILIPDGETRNDKIIRKKLNDIVSEFERMLLADEKAA